MYFAPHHFYTGYNCYFYKAHLLANCFEIIDLQENGNLYFVVPIGSKVRILFNAHRIYAKEQVIGQLKFSGIDLKEFILIPENEIDGDLVLDPSLELLSKQKYACGCFWFTKYNKKED